MRTPQPGDTLGRYRLDRVIGQGGMGVVFAATDLRLSRTVAVKVITGPLATQPEFRDRFHHEATAMSRVDSPHVIAIHDHDEIDGVPFIVTQYVDGTDLATLVDQRGPMPTRSALELCAQVGRGLADVHRRGVLHRDVKPGNVLVREAGTPQMHAYLCDFGIARTEAANAPAATVAGAVAGTWAYLAPERLSGAPASPSSDIYALGCVLWKCLTGHQPYAGTEVQMAIAHAQAPVPQLPGDTPLLAAVNAVLARLLAKDPADRYPDADAARTDLARVAALAPPDTLESASPGGTVIRRRAEAVTDKGGPAAPAAPAAPGREAAGRRRRWPLLAAAGAVLLLVAGSVGWAVATRDDDPALTSGGTDDPAVEPVQGDLDGDQYGDGMLAQVDGQGDTVTTWRIRSTGHAFASPVESGAESGEPALADVDGDDLADEVWFQDASQVDENRSYTVRVVTGSGEIREQTTQLDDELFGTTEATFADVTADGRDDLVLDTETYDDREGLHVAVSNGNGFEDPTQWWAGDGSGSTPLDLVGAGDLDGDGTVELASLHTEFNESYTRARHEARLIEVDGESFVVGEPIVLDDLWLPASGKVADVDGDSAAELVLVGGERNRIGVTRVEDGVFDTPEVWRTGDLTQAEWEREYERFGPRDPAFSTLSDVDGDGDADFVFLEELKDQYEMWVMLSDGARFPDAERWASVPCPEGCDDAFLFVE